MRKPADKNVWARKKKSGKWHPSGWDCLTSTANRRDWSAAKARLKIRKDTGGREVSYPSRFEVAIRNLYFSVQRTLWRRIWSFVRGGGFPSFFWVISDDKVPNTVLLFEAMGVLSLHHNVFNLKSEQDSLKQLQRYALLFTVSLGHANEKNGAPKEVFKHRQMLRQGL